MAKGKQESLQYSALLRSLRSEGPGRLYMFWGEEDYLISCFAEELKKACVAGAAEDFDYKRLEGPGLSQEELRDALDAMPFFGERTYVELHGVDINKCTDSAYAELLGDVPEWCTVLITLPAGMKPDGRLNLVKRIKKDGCAGEFTAQSETELYRWLNRRFAAMGKSIDRPAMERLLFLSGDLMNRLIPEIEKICAYAAGEQVTVADVEAVAHHIPEADVFEMTDALSRGDGDKAARLLAELLAGNEEPIMITAVIGGQFRRLYAARLALEEGLGASFVQEVTGQKDYAARRLLQSARSYTLEELRQAVRLCAQTDYRLKSDNSVTGAERMEELLIRLAMNSHAAH